MRDLTGCPLLMFCHTIGQTDPWQSPGSAAAARRASTHFGKSMKQLTALKVWLSLVSELDFNAVRLWPTCNDRGPVLKIAGHLPAAYFTPKVTEA